MKQQYINLVKKAGEIQTLEDGEKPWIPSQADLQRVLALTVGVTNVHVLMCHLEDTHENHYIQQVIQLPEFSMEEMWLHTVMRVAFEKEWNKTTQQWDMIL